MHYRHLGPFPFERDPRWRWRVSGYAEGGHLWPYELEVRFLAEPCGHYEKPASHDETSGGIEWEANPEACDCWPSKAPSMADLPNGGLSARMFRDIRLGLADERLRVMAGNVDAYDLWRKDDLPGAADFNTEVRKTRERPRGAHFTERGPGRPAVADDVHLMRLAALMDAYASGKTQAAAARKLRLSEPTLRVSIDWARREGYWTAAQNGRRGEPTAAGLVTLAEWRARHAKKGTR